MKDERLFLVPTGIRKKLSIMPRFKPWNENLRLRMTLDMKQQHVIRDDWHCPSSALYLSVLQEEGLSYGDFFLVFSEVPNSKKAKILHLFMLGKKTVEADEGLRAKCCGCC